MYTKQYSQKNMCYTLLFLHHTSNFSGAENSLLNLVTRLDIEKFRSVFICPSKGEFAERLLEKKIQVIHHNFGKNREIIKLLKSVRDVCRAIRSQRAALIHSNGPQSNIPAGLAGRLMGIPVIWHARNLLKVGMTDVDRRAGFLANRIICNSESIRARFKGTKYEKISKTIINGVDLTEFNPLIPHYIVRKEFGIPFTAKVLGMSSRLGKDKGHLTLLKAAAKIRNQYPDLWIIIVGGNVFEEDNDVPGFLKQKAYDLGISQRTVFTGFRKDVHRLYAAMDIFILGTDAEPCGRVIFEAMAMKKPVIGTNSGGTPEIVNNGETGLLFKYGDSEELSTKIDYLFKNPKLMQMMGNAGRKRIKKYFTIEKNVQLTQKVYLDLLERRR